MQSAKIDRIVTSDQGQKLRDMSKPKLSVDDLMYVADMLRAVAWVREDLRPASPEALHELEECLSAAESALRRVAAEMNVSAPVGQKSN